MTTIKGPTQTKMPCGPADETAPPKPEIVRSMAFDRAKDGSSLGNRNNGGRGVSAGTRDPVYIELKNVEVGTHIELLNLSKNPRGEFNKEDTIKLELTGRNVTNREGAVYLTQKQMDELGLKPGDMYQLRAVDQAGNASEAVSGEIQPNEWANGGEVIEDGRWSGARGAQLSALDGESQRKTLIAKAVNDSRPPMVKDEFVSIATKDDGQTSMLFDRAIEPGAVVTVQNSRTGKSVNGTVPPDGKLEIALTELSEGDPLVVSVRDNNGIEGKQQDIVYSSKCKDGKAPSLKGGLGARLTGVI